MKVEEPGSVANKLKELMRIGRSYGINFMLSTQKATSEEVPSQLKLGLSMKMGFRPNKASDISAIDLPEAADIEIRDRGRCAYSDGFLQYPYLCDESINALLNEFYKPLKSQLLYYQVNEYREELGLDE